ncbi:Carboxylesterase family-domain-containing protein [Cantharellus anzutake]|uniref:Carboxylesterase family-domain-containing protein n=1 Tax=Cantharellus anzutake TaxID=1750568 RepID=UPI001906AC7F|nr:Carboxylesterase family-domain-containing protein [Cantharellus anzutake]KAF8334763.1 Carboxylesterase family-domain-containing protein [Cantharellus anzutake]
MYAGAWWLLPASSHWQRDVLSPQIQLPQGFVTGLSAPQFCQDYFLGIPYAQPPLGKLRFAKPQPLGPNPSHKVDATQYGKACFQPLNTTPIITASDLSEDCLFVNVFRPSNLPHGAKLPVMVWIHGGGFAFGASQLYNGSVIVEQSVHLNESIIYVSFNYRLNAFGFLAAPQLAHASTGTLNAGLHDMIGALKWVQENIAAFGGNKDRVTVFGQSAGAVGIGSLLVAGGGHYVKQHNLFHGAIMESGAPGSAPVLTVSDVLPWTDIFAAAAGCLSSDPSIISCLRSKPSEVLYHASLVTLNTTDPAFIFNHVVDGFFFEEEKRAAEEVRRGNVADVPIITGCNLDEGTLFVPHTFNTTDEIVNYFRGSCSLTISCNSSQQRRLFKGLLGLYPDIPAIGSPYDPVGVSKDDRFFGPNNQYKRAASLFGDVVFHSGA